MEEEEEEEEEEEVDGGEEGGWECPVGLLTLHWASWQVECPATGNRSNWLNNRGKSEAGSTWECVHALLCVCVCVCGPV